MAMLTTFIPTMLLSGFIYPIFNMPAFVQGITYLVPARYYIVILRELFLKGGGFDVIWDEALFLFIFGFFMLFITVRKFKKKILA